MGKSRNKRSLKTKNRVKALRKDIPREGGRRRRGRNNYGESSNFPKKKRGVNLDAKIETPDEFQQWEPEEYKAAPHSFIIHKGTVGQHIKNLLRDIRSVMEPYTAAKLKMTKGNVLKDYVAIASYFHVTHLLILSKTKLSPYLKLCRIPRGPSLSFKILEYTLSRDILSSLKKQVTYSDQFKSHPLLIMNNFDNEEKTQALICSTFQNMFPSININTVNVKNIRRVLLVNYNKEDDTIDIRHYTITYKPIGISRGMKKLLVATRNKMPNLGKFQDISEFLNRDGDASESEGEDMVTESVTVTGKQKLAARGTKGVDEVAVKLVELGPRLKIQLMKVEEGLLDGEVLYHKLINKTDEEKLAERKEKNAKRKIRQERQKQQEKNVEKKRAAKDEHKRKCLQGMKRNLTTEEEREISRAKVRKEMEEEDRDWFRKEVGKEPDF